MTTHPHEEQLSAYLDGMLDIRQMRQVAHHLGACARCRAVQTSLLQTKATLRDLAPPTPPDADFWANTYRRMRTEGETRPAWGAALRDMLASSLPGTQRRWAAGVAAAAAIGLAVAGPLLSPSNGTHPTSSVTVSADSVDLSSLVRAHTESAARQPLADADRQTMINADTDGGAGFNDIAAESMGDGGVLPPMRLVKSGFTAWGAFLCLAAMGAGTQHVHRTPSPLQSRRPVVLAATTLRPAISAKSPPSKTRIPTAAALYPKSLHADDLYSYRGRQITTYWRSGRAEAVVISHLAPGMRRIDYLAPDIERGRSVVTDGAQQWQYDPRSRQLLHRRLDPNAEAVEDAAESYDLLRQNFVLQVSPATKTFADRKAFLLSVTRKTNRTVARKLWIDAATGVVLKRENYREDGKPSLTVAFSDINYHALLPPSLFDLSTLARRPGVRVVQEAGSTETSLPLTSLRSQLGGAALTPPMLNGFRLVSAALTKDGKTPLLHLRYSDGLNLVSLFEQRRTQVRRPTRVPLSMRPTHIGRRDGHVVHHASITALNWDTDTLNLTLMGEVAEMSLKGLALAIDPGGPR